MAINFRTTPKVDSDRDYHAIAKSLKAIDAKLPQIHNELRVATNKCIGVKSTMRYIDQMGSTKPHESDPKIEGIIASLRQAKPECSLHDIHSGLEGVLEDYSKKVATFAQTMVTTVKQYSTGLFDLFVKKLRINKSIDTSKFVGLDAAMSMVVMTYGDYCELGHPIVEKSANMVKEIQAWFPSLGRVKKALKNGDNAELQQKMAELTGKIHEGELISYLKDHMLVTFSYGPGVNGTEGLNKIEITERFKKLESSQVLNEAGWDDVDKLKNSTVLQNVEDINKNINNLYKCSIDLMDEVRRISEAFCVKDPYVCAALVKYGSLVAQMVNCYTKAFDMCWTTCLRVSQACLVEG